MALTLEQQDAVWERWGNGEPVRVIARAVCCNREAVRRLLAVAGGIRPAARSRAPLRLSLTEREEISRGLAAGDSARAIATRQQRLTRNTEVHRALQPKGPYGPRQARARLSRCHATAGAIGFPPANFKHSLTLFSKFFASFPHGTCSLSVSRQYLALDGIYHPLQAALPSSPTRQERIVRPRATTAQDSHLLRYPVPRDLSGGRGRWRISRLQFRRRGLRIGGVSSARFIRHY